MPRPIPPRHIPAQVAEGHQELITKITPRKAPWGWLLGAVAALVLHVLYFPPVRPYMPFMPDDDPIFGIMLILMDLCGASVLAYTLIRPRLAHTQTTATAPPPTKIVPAKFQGWADGPRPGLTFGYRADHSEIFFKDDELRRNVMIIGSSGSGKTSLLNALAAQQMFRGGGILFVDGKRDVRAMETFLHLASMVDRVDDVRILDPLNPEVSHNYNPLLANDASQEVGAIATKLHRLLPTVPESSPAKFYHDHAYKALLDLVKFFHRIDRVATFLDYRAIFEYPDHAFAILRSMLNNHDDIEKIVELQRFVKRFKSDAKGQDLYSGIMTELGALTDRETSKFITSPSNEINLYSAIKRNQLTYVGLPRLQEPRIAEQLGRVLLTDLQTTIGSFYNQNHKPYVPFLVLMDELASYVFKEFAVVFEQARGAGFICVGVLQALPQLQDKTRDLGPDFMSRVMGNCQIKLSLQVEDQMTANMMSEYFGKEVQWWGSIGNSSGKSDSGQLWSLQRFTNPRRGISKSESLSYSEKLELKIQPQQFIHGLTVGQGIIRDVGNPTPISTIWANPDRPANWDLRRVVPKLPNRHIKPLDLWGQIHRRISGEVKQGIQAEEKLREDRAREAAKPKPQPDAPTQPAPAAQATAAVPAAPSKPAAKPKPKKPKTTVKPATPAFPDRSEGPSSPSAPSFPMEPPLDLEESRGASDPWYDMTGLRDASPGGPGDPFEMDQ